MHIEKSAKFRVFCLALAIISQGTDIGKLIEPSIRTALSYYLPKPIRYAPLLSQRFTTDLCKRFVALRQCRFWPFST